MVVLKKIVKTYDYQDESGKPLFQVVRFEPKEFRQRRSDGNGGWVWNLDGVRRVPYRLPELLGSPTQDWLFVVEGEKDVERLGEMGFTATCCPMGAGKWRSEYNEHLRGRLVAIIPDNDAAGRNHARQVANSLYGVAGEIRIVELPGLQDKEDVSDWLSNDGDGSKLLKLVEAAGTYEPGKVDISRFAPMSSQELVRILGLTIKRDEANKLLTFLCELSAYTEGAQFNISYNAPSSTGKSFIPTEIARLFPKEDIIEIGYCSPTAFFHDVGKYDKGKGGYVVDLSRKVLIFLDQPHTLLLQHLRPMLSHDQKQICMKITDKSQKHGLRTKNILLIGFPAVIFCSAGLKMDEQEATRFLLLSPETNQEKIRQAVCEKLKKETDAEAYRQSLDDNPERRLLKQRILAIRQAHIEHIKIAEPRTIEARFFDSNRILKPRHSRDIGRLIALVKAFALLNLWFRERDGDSIVANDDDVREAFKVWDGICESQDLGLPPYIYQLYREVILPAYRSKNDERSGDFEKMTGKLGLSRGEIVKRHYDVYGRLIDDWQLRQQVLPMLEAVGLIVQEADPNDKRKKLIYPTALLTISDCADSGNTGQNSDFLPGEIVSGRVGYEQCACGSPLEDMQL
jgi:hypothetical protein